jgi:UDP-N-acetylmuramyl pentapeptide phosphotransferase/UDP-N-acetylglucosamine-1-phosphate transferase
MISLLLILALIISFTITLVVRKIALHKKLLDIPNERSSHTRPTPRGGGIAILIAWYFGLFWLYYSEQIESQLFLALICGLILAIVSFIDDIFTIKPWVRIIFQLITVLVGLYFIGGIEILYLNDFKIFIPLAFNIIIILGAIWYINLYNFLDGIDGYASLEAISIAIGMYIVTGNPLLLLLVFSVLGFLIWNWPRAKIFMGDIGSTQLGYVFVILGIHFNNKMELNIMAFVILTSLFWFDATLTLYRRWKNNEKLSQAHKKHGYQRIVQFGFSHLKTIIISVFINLIFIVLAFLSERCKIPYVITISCCLIINAILIKMIDCRFPFESSGTTLSKE